jgi:hypothetical protein
LTGKGLKRRFWEHRTFFEVNFLAWITTGRQKFFGKNIFVIWHRWNRADCKIYGEISPVDNSSLVYWLLLEPLNLCCWGSNPGKFILFFLKLFLIFFLKIRVSAVRPPWRRNMTKKFANHFFSINYPGEYISSFAGPLM